MIRAVTAAAFVALAMLPVTASAAAPIAGSVFGPVTSVKGSTFVLTTTLSPTGKSTVSVPSTTVITEQATAKKSSLAVGTCVSAMGTRNSKGVVAATRIMISAPVKEQCTTGFGGRGGARPGGTRPPGSGSGTPRPPGGGFGGAGNFGFAFGSVTALKGDTLTVKGSRGTTKVTTTVTVSAKTQLLETVKVKDSAIVVKSCAFVNGTSNDKGVTIKAQDIRLSKEMNGSCTTGFRRP